MGGSAKQVRDKVAKETGYTGSDLDKGAQHIGKKGAEVVEGVREHGSNIVTGVGQGIGKLGTEAMSGLSHNLGQIKGGLDMIFGHGGGGDGGSSGAQSASANYSGSSKRSRSGAKKKGDLEAQERKGATGKQKLYARRKTA